MILNNGEDWQPEPADIELWKKCYGAISVDEELLKMEAWMDSQPPQKRKTPRGIKRFVNSWLARAQDRGGSPDFKRKGTEVKQMSTTDDLTHVFVDCEASRQRFLEKYGQYYENGKRYTG